MFAYIPDTKDIGVLRFNNKNMTNKPKKQKKIPKAKILSKLRKKLYKTWSLAVRERDGNKCIFCGAKSGDINKNNKGIVLNAHHCLSRDIRNSPLKFDIRNGVTLCPEHHKFSGTESAHKAPIIFYDWLRLNRADQYDFVLKNATARADLDDETILNEILSCLENKKDLDIDKIKIDTTTTDTTTTERTLFNSV